MTKAVCRCIVCGKRLEENDNLWQVMRFEVFNARITRVFSPTCSEKCAKEAQQTNIDQLESYLADVRNQTIQKTTVKDHIGI